MVSAFCHIVDTVNYWLGRTVAWLFIPLTLIVTTDVFLRYFFNKPQLWAWDVNTQLQGAFVILAGGYVLLRKSHVAIDILPTRLQPRRKLILDTVTGMLLIASVALLLWPAVKYAWSSWTVREALTTALEPPIYPFKIIMAIGVALLLLQGISEFLKNLTALRHGKGAVK